MLISFVGGGNMTTAMLSGMLQNGFQPQDIYVVDPNQDKREALMRDYGIRTGEPSTPLPLSDMVILAVKPQQLSTILPQINAQLKTTVFVSILAGVSIEALQLLFKTPSRIIRVMPNTPSLVGAGVSGVFASSQTTKADKELAQRVLEAIGKVIWVNNESTLEAITAVSGCGPAYVFACMAALQEAAQKQGFDVEMAKELVYATFSGTIKLAEASLDSVYTLQKRVMSKGGVTERAIAVLEEHKLANIMDEAVQVAKKRSHELELLFLDSLQLKEKH